LPPDGDEPDWKKLEAAIRAEVSPLSTPAPWWRNWRWLVPIGALATTAAIVLTIGIRNGGHGETASATRITMRDASVEQAVDETDKADLIGKTDAASDNKRAAAVWLDGEPADLDDTPESPDTLEDLDDVLDDLERDARAPSEISAAFDEPGADDEPGTDEDGRALGVLPATDYQWIDTLRDDEATRLETFLARKRS